MTFEPGTPPAEAATDDHVLATWLATVAGVLELLALEALPDLIVCRPELAERIVDFVKRHGTD